MGPGGYKTAKPKWDMEEAAMREKGIEPEIEEWPRRSRNRVLGHGGAYDTQTGKLIKKKNKIDVPMIALVETITKVREGKFHPDRENNKLTKALKNPEHTVKEHMEPHVWFW
jgi:hypothetical protein